MVRAAVVGHSQVPHNLHIENVETRIFRKPGARVRHFYDEILNNLLEYAPDIVILFLGGNDIDTSEDCASRIANSLKNIIQVIKANCQEVIVVDIEWRNFTSSRVPGLTREIYNHRRRQIDRNLARFCNARQIRTINTSLEAIQRVRGDGVHFDALAAAKVKSKITNAILHASNRLRNVSHQ